nr:MAG TPA: hypothetical protein [Caudoviricetes sp.]
MSFLLACVSMSIFLLYRRMLFTLSVRRGYMLRSLLVGKARILPLFWQATVQFRYAAQPSSLLGFLFSESSTATPGSRCNG